jgi:hypothetical protein
MILVVMLIGIPLGFVVGVTHRVDVFAFGAVVTIVGWWILWFTIGDVEFSFGTLAATTLASLGNLAVGTFVGWALGAGLRALFGMTSER